MLGYLLLFIVGKTFYNLALKYSKNKWLFAFSGIAAYYLGLYIGIVFFALFSAITGYPYFDSVNESILSVLALPFGLLLSLVFYIFLKRKWSTIKMKDTSDILDTNFLEK